MRIYIASSWKNQHAVELLTHHLRDEGHEVLSFIENNNGENAATLPAGEKPVPFEEWVWSDSGFRSFVYDTRGATESDLVIYVGPSGCDAWAEVGAAWSRGVPVFGLNAKGEQIGLMRRMVTDWHQNWATLMDAVAAYAKAKVAA